MAVYVKTRPIFLPSNSLKCVPKGYLWTSYAFGNFCPFRQMFLEKAEKHFENVILITFWLQMEIGKN